MIEAGSTTMPDHPLERWKAARTHVPTPEERAVEVARAEELTTGDVRRSFLLALGGCVFWLVVALASIGWAIHTTDPGWGRIAFLAGLITGYTGIVVTVARYYLEGQKAGWW